MNVEAAGEAWEIGGRRGSWNRFGRRAMRGIREERMRRGMNGGFVQRER